MADLSTPYGSINTKDMKTMLRMEELALLLLAYALSMKTGFAWWWFPLLLLLPDLSMIGYASGPRTGAFIYNMFHFRALAILVAMAGYFSDLRWLVMAGLVLFGHSTLDRIFGYGLKYPDHFKHTHMGWIGKS